MKGETMIKGRYVANGIVHEINHGNGLIELVPEIVEPSEPFMQPLDALFYFRAVMPKRRNILRKVLICAATVAPVVMVSAFGDRIMDDNIFGALCWATIGWVGFVVFANCRRRR